MPERRCAFLRMADASGWSIDADLAFGPLDNLGWYCEWLCWRDRDELWDDWDAVYLAAPWDYPDDPNGFLEVLGIIDRSRAVLLNPLEHTQDLPCRSRATRCRHRAQYLAQRL